MRIDIVDMESIQLINRIQQELDLINYGEYKAHEAFTHICFLTAESNLITAAAISVVERYLPFSSVGVDNEGKVFALFGDLR